MGKRWENFKKAFSNGCNWGLHDCQRLKQTFCAGAVTNNITGRQREVQAKFTLRRCKKCGYKIGTLEDIESHGKSYTGWKLDCILRSGAVGDFSEFLV